ncbi:anti-sigma-K factor RskA [Nocardia tenerifensis]|uniref:Regulator of SigK n=1 Tax=Nocardia tenerifensis TaxID=228006 RepID=A0A318K9K5_9NOCA|nr:anti-sigma factor [Nocardia tenerifensis]PXX71008.1 anti-sigma-K factor RskA [Nocardia tenerifensis]
MSHPGRRGTDLLDLAYPYAMDAVAELERRAIEHRLRAADPAIAASFAAIVSGVRETMAALTVLDAAAPPPELEDAVLRALDDGAPSKSRTRFERWRWLAAAVAVVVAIGAGVGVLSDNASVTPELTAQTVLEQPDVMAKSVPVAGGGTLTLRISARIAAATVTFESVAAPPPGRSYQVWLIPMGGSPRSARVMTELPAEGPAMVTRFDPVDTLAVTVEPAAGSPDPTTDPIASVNLT